MTDDSCRGQTVPSLDRYHLNAQTSRRSARPSSGHRVWDSSIQEACNPLVLPARLSTKIEERGKYSLRHNNLSRLFRSFLGSEGASGRVADHRKLGVFLGKLGVEASTSGLAISGGCDMPLGTTKASMHHHLRPPPSAEYVRAYRDEHDTLRLPKTPAGTIPLFRLALRELFQLSSGDDGRIVTRTLGAFRVSSPHGDVKLTLNYIGLQLGQFDLDVFIALLRLAEPVGLGHVVQVSCRQVLNECGLSDCSDNYQHLRLSLRRLWQARFEVASAGMVAGTPWSLVERFCQERVGRNGAGAVGTTHVLSFAVGQQLAELFHLNTWVKLDTDVRRQLKGRGEQLARWLHAFLTTYGGPYVTDLDALYRQSGATCTPNAFIKQFDAAATLLKKQRVVSDVDVRTMSGRRLMGETRGSLTRKRVTFSPASATQGSGFSPRHQPGVSSIHKEASTQYRAAPTVMVADLEPFMF